MPYRERAWIIPTALFHDPPALRHMLEMCRSELGAGMRDERLAIDATSLRQRILLPLPDSDMPAPAGDLLAGAGVAVERPAHAAPDAIDTAALLTTGARGEPFVIDPASLGDPSSSGGTTTDVRTSGE